MKITLLKSLLLFSTFLCIVTMQAQTVSGTVYDANGPLPGASVVVKGTTSGTQTDFDGNYTLDGVANNATLVFSYIGYATQEVAVNGRSTIDITLVEDAQALDEVVIIGYGTVRKEDQTTSVISVGEDEFYQGVINAPEELIQGKAAGVSITPSSGEPGAGLNIRIRGGKSITASNAPLYIIDGVPIDNRSSLSNEGSFNEDTGNPLAFLNPQDIASINVLKDAAAAAIYGSRGSNGVILITTKRGQSGEAKFSYSHNSSISFVRKGFDTYSADELRNLNIPIDITDSGGNTDWQDEIYQIGYSQNHNITMSGGGEGNSYFASLNYSDTEGVLPDSYLERISGRFNFSQSVLNDKLTLSTNLTVSRINRGFAPNEQGGGFNGGLLNGTFNYSPTQPVRQEDGSFSVNGNFNNPVQLIEGVTDRGFETRLLGSFEANAELFKNFTGTARLGFDYNQGERSVLRSDEIPGDAFSSVNRNTLTIQSKVLETFFTYDNFFGANDANNLQIVGGYSFQQFDNSGFGVEAIDLSFPNLGSNTFDTNQPAPERPRVERESSKLVSFYGRAQYSHQSKYILGVTFRADGSTRFGADNKWGYFPAFSAAWNITKEDFMESQNTFTNLKLRASYGTIGNQEIGNFRSLATLEAEDQFNNGNEILQAVFFNNFANPDLKWEETSTFNVGLDWGLLDGRLSGTFEYYISDTDDLLFEIPLPQPADPGLILANVGSVRNQGFEGSINFSAINTSNLKWDVGAVFATLQNEVTGLSSSEFSREFIAYGNVSGEGASGDNIFRIEVGQPLNAFYGRVFDGIVDGQETYADLDGDGDSDIDDRTFIGDSQPDFTYSLTSNLQYKNWDFRLFFRGVSGIDIFNNTHQTFGLPTRVSSRNLIRGFIEEGESTEGASRQFSSRFLEDGSFFRLDNVSLGYTFKNGFFNAGDTARITLSAQNVFLISSYNGPDPEVNTQVVDEDAGNIQIVGVDFLTYPRPTTISLGINVNF